MITAWNEIGDQWVSIATQLLWQGSLAIGIVWALAKLWPGLPASKRHWLWRLVYLKFLVLMVWQTPIQLPILPPETIQNSTIQTPVYIPDSSFGWASASHGLQKGPSESSSFPSPFPKPAAPSHITAASTPSLSACLSLLWAIGAFSFFCRSLRALRSTHRLKQTSQPLAGTAIHDTFVDLCQSLHLKVRPRLLSHSAVPSPLVVGCLRPCIIIPEPDDPNAVQPESRLVLLHELTHIARRDLWWAWLRVFIESLTFFHPLVWIARRHWNLSQEMACDEAVVTRAQVAAPTYQQALLQVLEQGRNQRQSSPHLIAVGASGSFRDMKERIIAMNQIKSHSPLYQLTVAALVASIGFAGVIPFQLVAKPHEEPQSESSSDSIFDDLESHAHAHDHNHASSHQDELVAPDATDSRPFNHANEAAMDDEAPILSPVIQGLAAALKSRQPEVRRRVVEALTELEDPATIPILITALKDPNKEVRHEALHGLEHFEDDRAVDAVSELLKSDSWKIRHQALEALEDIPHPKALECLVEALKDPHPKNRVQAIDALENHELSVPIDVLDEAIHDDHWEVRKEAIEALGEAGSASSVPHLFHALADDHPAVRNEARDALEDLDFPELDVHIEKLIAAQPDRYADYAEDLFEELASEKSKQEKRRHREQVRELERQLERAHKQAEQHARAAEQALRQHQEHASAMQDYQRHHGHEQGRSNLGAYQEVHPDSPLDKQNQNEAIQSIVDSVLSQVNAKVEEAIAKAMAEMRRNVEQHEKSGLDPFADDAPEDNDLFPTP